MSEWNTRPKHIKRQKGLQAHLAWTLFRSLFGKRPPEIVSPESWSQDMIFKSAYATIGIFRKDLKIKDLLRVISKDLGGN